MYDYFASLGIGLMLQIVQAGLAQGVLRVVLLVGPRQHYLAGTDKSTHIIHVLIGFVVVYATGQPQHLVNVEVLLKLVLNLCLGKVGIASCTKQARGRYHSRALPIHVNGAAL